MGMTSATVSLIKVCFAGRDALIEQAYRQSREFRTLCADYRACSAALKHWKASGEAEAPLRRQEYAELLVELDREIQRWLETLESATPWAGTAEPHDA